MPASTAFFLGLGLTLFLLTVVWIIQLRTRNAGLVDAVWSASLGLLAVLYALTGDAPLLIRVMLAILAGLWSARLAGYLGMRMRGEPEDSRYAAARESWGSRANLYMLLFFWFQAVIAAILSLPYLVLAYREGIPATPWLLLAVAVWVISVGGEALADRQLHRFKQNPQNRGKVCAQGLWRYSRHPNYFFESLHWVSYVLLAVGAGYWWATLFSPVIMAVLLLKVSGIPTIEGDDGKARREGYDEYIRRTSAFIPLPPRKT